MKLSLLTLLLFSSLYVFSQNDRNGSPVFNSIAKNEEKIDDYILLSSYYTIADNIDNKSSSVFVNLQPSMKEVEKFATRLPSDFFLVIKNHSVINLIMLRDVQTREFFVVDPAGSAQSSYPCALEGDISENRAAEIVAKYDTTAKIEEGYLYFNNKKIRIIPSIEIKNQVIDLIRSKGLAKADSSDFKMILPSELRTTILKGSKENGSLDFWTPIKGKEYEGVMFEKGVYTTNLGLAIYKWAFAVTEMGVTSEDEIISIYEELKQRKVNERDKAYLQLGRKKAMGEQ